jgi:hypothetical protein
MAVAERGVLYVASGRQYVNEACTSAESVKDHMPELPTLLHTHDPVDHPAIDRVVTDSALTDADEAKAHKIDCIANSPFRRTLFLDTDTHALGRVDELFDLLDEFDIGVAHAPNRLYFGDGEYPGEEEYPSDVPKSFPEMNTGVMVYDAESSSIESLFEAWRSRYEEMQALGVARDQISFREVLYESDVQMTVLPPEYNCRSEFPVYLEGEVKIDHARHPDRALARCILNETALRRTLQPWMFEASHFNRLQGFYRHLREELRTLLLPWVMD